MTLAAFLFGVIAGIMVTTIFGYLAMTFAKQEYTAGCEHNALAQRGSDVVCEDCDQIVG